MRSVPSSLLHMRYDCKFQFSRELFKNNFTGDRGQLRAGIDRNVFSKTSERLFLMLRRICGKVKLALNQKYINNTQNQTPEISHFSVKKVPGADTAWFTIREAKRVIESFYLLITLRN